MNITQEQINYLEKFTCERLNSNSNNLLSIKNFYSKRGSSLITYLNDYGVQEDKSGKIN